MKSTKAEVLQKSLLTIERAIGLHARSEATCCGVTLPQCHTIMEIGLAGKASVRDLSDALGLDKSTMSRTIDGLVEAGLVDRSLDADDRRYVVLSLTPKGLNAFGRIDNIWRQFCGDLMKNIPLKKHGQIIESLSLIGDALLKNGFVNTFQKTCCK